VLQICEEILNVKRMTVVKSFKKCQISIVLDGTEDFVLGVKK
jgi:hypothetical protein